MRYAYEMSFSYVHMYCREYEASLDIYKLQARASLICEMNKIVWLIAGICISHDYLVILLPGTRATHIDYFACEQRILARVHLRVFGLLCETLKAFDS